MAIQTMAITAISSLLTDMVILGINNRRTGILVTNNVGIVPMMTMIKPAQTIKGWPIKSDHQSITGYFVIVTVMLDFDWRLRKEIA